MTPACAATNASTDPGSVPLEISARAFDYSDERMLMITPRAGAMRVPKVRS